MYDWLSRRFTLCIALCALALVPMLAEADEITHFDLRQDGAAALVTLDARDGTPARYVLIDTGRIGGENRGAAIVRDELAKRGITRLDLVILTHLDADHAEGVFTLLGSAGRQGARPPDLDNESIRGPPVAIGRLLLPADTLPKHEQFRQELISAATTAAVEVLSPTPGVIADIQSEFGITVLTPPSKPKSPNETSLVIVGHDREKDTAFLFTGDIPAGMIRQMAAKLPHHVNVLQAPHHGADEGLLDLIAQTNPDYIVISANRGNRYSHPRLAILRSLAEIRPPPTRMSRVFTAVYSDERDRFNAAKLAREVRSRVDAAILRLKNPYGLGGIGPFDLSLDPPSALSFTSPPVPQRTFAKPIEYDQVLITGERGNLRFVDGKVSGEQYPETARFMSIVWRELRYAADNELRQLRNWDEAQAYLSIVAANRETFPVSPVRFDGVVETELTRARVLELGLSRVGETRWRQLVTMCLEQIISEREEALRAIRDEFLKPALRIPKVSRDELYELLAAAVADYQTGTGDQNTQRTVESINRTRQANYNEAGNRASEELRSRLERARPKSERGWLGPAMMRLGVPKPVAAFSAALLEAAAAKRLIIP